MAMLNQEDAELHPPQPSAVDRPRVRWTQILSISIFAFAFNFHWAALGTIILPSQVLKIVGDQNAGTALALVLVPGAFVSLVANPMFGWLSDRTYGRLAAWGLRRPYIFFGTVFNVAVLVWMASARDIPSLALGYALVQFFSNAAQAPFHALLPDIVPTEQRGLTSGTLGLLGTAGTIGGVIIAGFFVNSSKPPAAYQQGLWFTYGIIMVVMITLMLVTIFSVHERALTAAQGSSEDEEQTSSVAEEPVRRFSISRSTLNTIVGTLAVVLMVWGIMALWNAERIANIQIGSTVQQVILEVVATVGILRLFDFNPRRDPDFAWVLATRLILMLGIYTIQTFLQYYMHDAVGVANPEAATTQFVIIVAATSIVGSFVVGWLSDHFGRKRMVYLSGFAMALVGLIFVVTHSFVLVIASGALFGLGYGAYLSVDWALATDVLPSRRNFARDMGIWNVAASLPQVVAPALGGPIRDAFIQAGHPVQGYQVLFSMAIIYCIIGTITVRFIRGVKK
ncbi:MAG TPA: MFS transporter [Ktedonobacteraceae bacterium]|nr:MFS transporter [Ktedonobacteraceae bacterium]